MATSRNGVRGRGWDRKTNVCWVSFAREVRCKRTGDGGDDGHHVYPQERLNGVLPPRSRRDSERRAASDDCLCGIYERLKVISTYVASIDDRFLAPEEKHCCDDKVQYEAEYQDCEQPAM